MTNRILQPKLAASSNGVVCFGFGAGDYVWRSVIEGIVDQELAISIKEHSTKKNII